MDVSVIIVNWNTKELMGCCLNSIYQQAGKVSYEIIVVDNASTDGSAEMVKHEFPEVIVLQNTENRGFAAANNIGMAIAQGRYILLLNSDTIVLDNAIGQVVSFADLHPEIAVVGCKVLNLDGTLQRTCFMFPSLLNMLLSSTYFYKFFPRSKFFGREQMTWWDRNDIREVDVVTGCFMLVRRKAIDHVGLLDEGFFMYAEETDWCYRFKQAGWKAMFYPAAEIIHLAGQSSKQFQAKMLVQLRLSILRFINKHYGWLSYKIASLLVMLFFMIRIPVWLIVYCIRTNRRKVALMKLRAYTSGVTQILSGLTIRQ